MESQPDRQTQFSGCLVRLVWMVAGNAALFILLIAIVEKHLVRLGIIDFFYWTVAAATLLLRYIDVRFLHGHTFDGSQPATLTQLRRYAGILIGIALIGWLLAHGTAWLLY